MGVPSTQWVTDSIELVAPIAEGAMGSVWVAYHHRLQTRVAVKFVSTRLGDSQQEALARFEREASTASQIRNHHVVQIFDSGVSHSGAPYIVMELLDGESLGQRLRARGPLSLGEAGEVIAQVGQGLAKAHEHGIVHRDIKPDNIFLCKEDLPLRGQTAPRASFLCKILDFGIAKQTRLPAMGGLTTEGKLVGTPEYMSPEQVLEDDTVTFRADLWALAVVLYVALTGELPFKGKTLGQLCINLVSRKPAAPSSLRPELSPGMDAWFERALNRNPANRFDSAIEMAESFAAVASGVPYVAPAMENTERHFGSAADMLPPSDGRRPALAVGAVAAILLVGLGVAVSSAGKAPAALATASLAQAAASVVIEVQANNKQIVPTTTIDLDAVELTEDEEKDDSEPPAKSTAGSAPRKPARAPKPAPTKTDSSKADGNRRGKAELGF